MEQQAITLGKIRKKVEETLQISLPGDHKLYAETRFLDDLARRRPQDYLALLEETRHIILDPDFVSFDEERESLTYYRSYFDHGFVVVGAKFSPHGVPRGWCLVSLRKNPATEGRVERIQKKIAIRE